MVDPNIFAETPSAGSKEAWQTYWPGSASVVTNRIGPQPSWQLSNTEYMEPYLVAGENSDGTGGQSKKAARWFDTSVLRYNGMGQPQLPPSGTGARLEEAQALGDSWVQRAVNTSLLCKEAGCTASSKLTVFDPKKEETQRCRLSIHVHPTDYDNQWGQEFIKLWKVNDHMATAMCLPNALGCNASAWRPLIPCLQDLSVDHLLAESGGSLSIQGSINKLVDECPYQGYLLNAVAAVTCMARPKQHAVPIDAPLAQFGGAALGARVQGPAGAATLGAGPGGPGGPGAGGTGGGGALTGRLGPFGYIYSALGYAPGLVPGSRSGAPGAVNATELKMLMRDRLDPGMSFSVDSTLRCCAPGCATRGIIEVDPVLLRAGATCLLNFSVVQTDYDEAVGNDIERIEFIAVSGLGNVSKNIKPGRNPCTEEYSTGVAIPDKDKVKTIVSNQNVTAQLWSQPLGQLIIDSKISEQVDDCAYEDAFFHGVAVVTCTLPTDAPADDAETSSSAKAAKVAKVKAAKSQ